ncbi:hypothetical protein IMCC21906_01484 [Spongiibacter sp. IMCC21906]|uniref:hypothetical protein n=1 Tax=Spongiibacter sp. IMCC21906 TaxID=1620392 RepID=UPI00062E0BDF|nr:hypothetical protein [Spongiibacter sp. IMCC21906]AKH69162.1 hypothetical protein IMCC21906_01484 [Spongiibacter sp. IMCC21906]
MIKIMFSAILLFATLQGSSLVYANTNTDVSGDCLDWEIKTHPAGENLSSCAYYNPDKVSTRFVVSNHCQTSVRGVFSYYSQGAEDDRIMSVQAFNVQPGRTAEVANPCDTAGDWSYHVTQAN